jgi:hypothetical protein
MSRKVEKALTPKTSSSIINQLLRRQKNTRPDSTLGRPPSNSGCTKIPPKNPGSREGERLTYLLAGSGRSPAGTSTTANKSELPQKFKIPNPKLPNPSTINLVSKKK